MRIYAANEDYWTILYNVSLCVCVLLFKIDRDNLWGTNFVPICNFIRRRTWNTYSLCDILCNSASHCTTLKYLVLFNRISTVQWPPLLFIWSLTVENTDQIIKYSVEFMKNSLRTPGFLPHKCFYVIKKKNFNFLLQNIVQTRLCNGAWLIVETLQPNVLQATISIESYKGVVCITRILVRPTDVSFHFEKFQNT